jgi:hypothetical protein
VRNEMIGIIGVFVLVLALFVLRHFILTIGQGNKKHSITPTMLRATDKSKKDQDTDDAWLLWTPEQEDAGSPDRARDELAKHRARTQRKGDSTLR